MRRLLAGLVLVGLLLWLPFPASRPAAAATPVSGTLPADTTWNLTGSPYLVVGDVFVPQGVTLTIEPGVMVRFDTTPPASHFIEVRGTLLAVGTPAQRIVFTSDDAFPDRNDWVSVRFVNSTGSAVEFADLDWGSIAIEVRESSPRIANCTIRETGLFAIRVIGPNASPLIENNTLSTLVLNQRAGIIVQEADPVIRNNMLVDNFFGIFVSDRPGPRIEGNIIRDGWVGALLVATNASLIGNVIERNGIPNRGGYGLVIADSALTLINNTLSDNGIGIDLPYNSKGTLPLSSGNTVNGVPLDRLYTLGAVGLELADVDLDSGHSAGHVGNATQQGLLTFYDSVDVTVSRPRLRNNEALLAGVNSSLLIVNGTLTNSSNHVHLGGFSSVVTLNVSLDLAAVNMTDSRSTLTVKNFLHGRAVSETSVPLPGVRITVEQDGVEVGNRTTNAAGGSDWHVAAYGVLSRVGGGPRPDFFPSNVVVTASHPTWRFASNPRTVVMGESRTEVFRQVDQVPPEVLESRPSNNSIGVPVDSRITIVFSEAMNRTSVEAAIRVVGWQVGDFRWTPDGRTVSFVILDAAPGTTYFVEVRDTATDLAGNPLGDTFLFVFDTERPERRVDLTPVWAASLAVLVAGLAAAVWRRSRSRPESLGEEHRDPGEKGGP